MKTRKIKKLLQVMLDNTTLFEYGLCQWVSVLYIKNIINWNERMLLDKYISNNKPFNYKIRLLFSPFCNHTYYWKKGKIEPRIKWIKKHIKKLS